MLSKLVDSDMVDFLPKHLLGTLIMADNASREKNLDWLRTMTTRLSRGGITCEEEQIVSQEIFDFVTSPDCEVRRSVASALGELRHTDAVKIDIALSQLQDDSNAYVCKVASRSAEQRKRRNSGSTSHIPSPIESQGDRLYREVFNQVENIGVHNLTHRQIYEIATTFGNRAYAELAADTAHEVRSLLTPVEGSLVLVRRRLLEEKAPTPGQISDILNQLDLLKNLVESLQIYGASQIGPFQPSDIMEVLEESVSISMKRAKPRTSINLDTTGTKTLVNMVRKRLLRAFVNICTNALQSMPNGGSLTVSASLREADQKQVEVKIADTGRGMSEKQIERALQRFRSSRKDEGAQGLGYQSLGRLSNKITSAPFEYPRRRGPEPRSVY